MKFAIQGQVHQFQKYSHIISKEKLEEIRKKDSSPKISIYSIAYEGSSKPNILSGLQKIFRWGKEAVRKVTEKVVLGTKVFLGHGETNSHENRKKIAEVIGKDTVSIDGIEHSIVAVYPADESQDVISLEGDLVWSEDGEVLDVESISALAVENSKNVTPAFEKAVQIGQVQFFENKELENKESPKKTMNIEEVRAYIAANNIEPYQLYQTHKIIGEIKFQDGKIVFEGGDPNITRILETKTNKLTEGVFQRVSDLEKEKITIGDKLKALEALEKSEKLKSRETLLDGVLKERKYSAKQIDFIRLEKSGLEKEGEDKLVIESFIADRLKIYKEAVDKKILIDDEGTKGGGTPDPDSGKGKEDNWEDIQKRHPA